MGSSLFPPSRNKPGEVERSLRRLFASMMGVDEAGRGALCGPVVAAAVALPDGAELPGVTDSKALSAAQREALVPLIKGAALAWGIGEASAAEVDEVNVLQATFRAMRRAVAAASAPGYVPDVVLVDGPYAIPDLGLPQKPVVKGDSRSLAIAAASILAKTHRDRLMVQLHERFPLYGLNRHMGYGTEAHRAAIATHGFCPQHRKTFCHSKRK